MYYKAEKGTKAYDRLLKMHEFRIDAIDKANEIVEKLGYEKYIGKQVGGLVAVQAKEKPEGFKIYEKHRSLYSPRKNSKYYEIFESVPSMNHDKYNETIGFKRSIKNGKIVNSFGYSYLEVQNIFLVDTGSGTVDCEGIVEILHSEYLRLQGK
jgi:uncharacterized protein YbaR (Trm112 family)